jgi:hypothetical protein
VREIQNRVALRRIENAALKGPKLFQRFHYF